MLLMVNTFHGTVDVSVNKQQYINFSAYLKSQSSVHLEETNFLIEFSLMFLLNSRMIARDVTYLATVTLQQYQKIHFLYYHWIGTLPTTLLKKNLRGVHTERKRKRSKNNRKKSKKNFRFRSVNEPLEVLAEHFFFTTSSGILSTTRHGVSLVTIPLLVFVMIH